MLIRRMLAAIVLLLGTSVAAHAITLTLTLATGGVYGGPSQHTCGMLYFQRRLRADIHQLQGNIKTRWYRYSKF